jgi:2-keto-4-pentenoate hydratase/2-oxohepta-3-ene-1,7-dioic acid hydratase in catechol pathway
MSKPIAAAAGFFKRQFAPTQLTPKQSTPKQFTHKRPYEGQKYESKPYRPRRPRMINPSTYWKFCRNIIAIGRNYAYVFPVLLSICCVEGLLTFSDHIAELGNQRPTKPFYFLKPWTSIVPPDSWVEDSYNPDRKIVVKKPAYNVLIPNGVNVHYEVELAVIFNKDLSNLAYQKKIKSEQEYEELWKDSIAGYAIGTISNAQLTYSSHRFDCKKSTG